MPKRSFIYSLDPVFLTHTPSSPCFILSSLFFLPFPLVPSDSRRWVFASGSTWAGRWFQYRSRPAFLGVSSYNLPCDRLQKPILRPFAQVHANRAIWDRGYLRGNRGDHRWVLIVTHTKQQIGSKNDEFYISNYALHYISTILLLYFQMFLRNRILCFFSLNHAHYLQTNGFNRMLNQAPKMLILCHFFNRICAGWRCLGGVLQMCGSVFVCETVCRSKFAGANRLFMIEKNECWCTAAKMERERETCYVRDDIQS